MRVLLLKIQHEIKTKQKPTNQHTKLYRGKPFAPTRVISPLTFLSRPGQDGLPLAQQGVRGDCEKQAQAGRRPEGLRGRRPRPRRKAPQEAEVPRELAERRGEASAARLSPAEAGVPVGSRGRKVLCGFEGRSYGGVPRCLRYIHTSRSQQGALLVCVRVRTEERREQKPTGPAE